MQANRSTTFASRLSRELLRDAAQPVDRIEAKITPIRKDAVDLLGGSSPSLALGDGARVSGMRYIASTAQRGTDPYFAYYDEVARLDSGGGGIVCESVSGAP